MGCHDRTELWVSSGVQIAIWISIRSPLVHTLHTVRNTTLSSTRLGPAGHVSQKYYGMVRPRGAEEREREELDEDWDATVAKDGRRVGEVIG